ncbi:signal peptidase I [Catenuloplanes japonicus]|uniref:signal peptidase I n=1 Tax=Catenuloplanes japonicus TaxID=33876 RepID=UPI0005261F4C|nr:signal peptidase I [Catenuloplanes japonicus]
MDPLIRRLAAKTLTMAVRGRKEHGGEWGEAVLAEFGETTGTWEAVRWAAGGLRTVWRERRGRELPRPVRIRRRAVRTLVIGLVAGLAVNQWVMTVGVMASGAMEPTMLIADRYLMDKAAFRLSGLKYDDIVVYAMPENGNSTVKRVIGLPGDAIGCQDGRMIRNGVPIDEPYLAGNGEEGPEAEAIGPVPYVVVNGIADCPTVTVPPDQLYLVGDHRLVSLDSRSNGPVDLSAVQARVLGTVWPLSR